MIDVVIQHKWLFAIIGEIAFFVLAGAFFMARYWFHMFKASYIFVLLLILNELFLALLAVFDYMETGKFSSFQIVTVIFYIYLIFEGKSEFSKLNRYFKKKVAKWKGETLPDLDDEKQQEGKKYGAAHAKEERQGWYMHLLIFMIAQVVFLFLFGFSGWHSFNINHTGDWFQVYNNLQVNKVNGVWGIVLIIDGLISFSYTIWPKKEKRRT